MPNLHPDLNKLRLTDAGWRAEAAEPHDKQRRKLFVDLTRAPFVFGVDHVKSGRNGTDGVFEC